jgi:hypothetical protein
MIGSSPEVHSLCSTLEASGAGRAACGRFSLPRGPARFGSPAIATVVPTTAVTTAAATTTTTATATAAAATEATTTTALAGLALLGLVDAEGAAVEICAVHLFDGLTRFFAGCHHHETKATRTARHAVQDELRLDDLTAGLEGATEAIFGRVERQVPYVQSVVHLASRLGFERIRKDEEP